MPTDTLCEPFYDKMIGSISSNFSDIVIIGEKVESDIKSERIARPSLGAANTKKPLNGPRKKKKGEVNVVKFIPLGDLTIRPPITSKHTIPHTHPTHTLPPFHKCPIKTLPPFFSYSI